MTTLGHRDGGLQYEDQDAIEEIGRLIDDVRPDTILTFGADGMTFDPDHIAVHHWVLARPRLHRPAALRHDVGRIPLAIPRPGRGAEHVHADECPTGVPANELSVHVRLDGAELDRKLAALRAMASQTSGLIEMVGPDAYAEQVCEEWFVDARQASQTAPDRSVLTSAQRP